MGLLLLHAAHAASLPAQQSGAAGIADSVYRLVEQARIAGRSEGFAEAQVLLDRALTAYPDEPLLLHYKGWSLFVEAGLARGGRTRRPIGALLEEAQEVLERSVERKPLAETYALQASVMGQRIGENPALAMTLGIQSGRAMDRARQLGPNNPRVWLLDGQSAIFTPAMFGGGLDKAEERLKRSIALFETDHPAAPLPRWGKAEAHLWLGQVHHRAGRFDAARQSYQAALAIEPENLFVKNGLLPQLDRKEKP